MKTIPTEEQNAAAFAILNNYHGPVVDEIAKTIATAKDLSEFKIISDLLRGGLEHMLATHGMKHQPMEEAKSVANS